MGRAPHLQVVQGTTHVSADEQLFDEMLRGYGLMALAAGRDRTSVEKMVRVLKMFAEWTGKAPWEWDAIDVDAWSADMVLRGLAKSTLRGRQGVVRRFCEYLVNPSYPWVDRCMADYGRRPEQICHEWNTARHVEEYDTDPSRRALTHDELEALLNAADDHVEDLLARNHRGAVPAWRDATMMKLGYGTGVRPIELVKFQINDMLRHPEVPQFDRYALFRVRWGKRSKGGSYKQRGVQLVFDWVVDAVRQYHQDVRPALPDGPWLFPSERRDSTGRQQHVTVRTYEVAFAARRRQAGLPEELTPHCLRHTWQTDMALAGRDALWRQKQAGHKFLSTTGIYTHVDSEHMNREMAAAIRDLTDTKDR